MASKRISVDRAEYDALCELRDDAHEALKLQLLRLQANHADLIQINRDAVSRCNTYNLQIAYLQTKLDASDKARAALELRILELSPATFTTTPPGRR